MDFEDFESEDECNRSIEDEEERDEKKEFFDDDDLGGEEV